MKTTYQPSKSYPPTLFAVLLIFALSFIAVPVAQAQFSLGADFMSRYVWRGFDFGDAVSIQPSASYANNGFEIGTWASYSIDAGSAGASEHDLWVQYSHTLKQGTSIGIGVTDYYFPNAGVGYFDWSDDGGAHQIEPFLSITGPESFPISIWASIFVHNEPDNATYLEFSYPFSIEEVDLSLAMGGAPTSSDFYLNPDGPALTNVSLSATRNAPITDSFSLPLSVQYIVNPHQEISYLVFGVSL